MLLRIFALILAVFSQVPLFAQWKIGMKNSLEDVFNSRLFLSYTAASENTREFLVDVRFRPEGSFRTYLRKEIPLTLTGSDMISVPVKLPPGDYEVDVDIRDRSLKTHTSLALESPFQVYANADIKISDIFLSYQENQDTAFSAPILDRILSDDEEKLFYYIELKAPGYESLNVRAVLYKEDREQETPGTLAFKSLYQSSEVLFMLGNKSAVFKDVILLNNLSEGDYLLDIGVYDDDEPLESVNVRFEMGGDIQKRIFTDLNESIRMMEYTLSVDILESLLRLPDEGGVKETEFMEVWQDLYGKNAEEMMENYFKKIFTCNDRFREDIEGWQTDRGKIFVQYGEPRITQVKIRDKNYERWTYGKWALSFLFEKRNNRYILVE